MILIPLENDQKTIAHRFRQADSFAFVDGEESVIEKNTHKTSKSPQFFEYFKTLTIDTLYVKDVGYKTFLNLLKLEIKVYLIPDATQYNQIKPNEPILLDRTNAKAHCSLGHHNKEAK